MRVYHVETADGLPGGTMALSPSVVRCYGDSNGCTASGGTRVPWIFMARTPLRFQAAVLKTLDEALASGNSQRFKPPGGHHVWLIQMAGASAGFLSSSLELIRYSQNVGLVLEAAGHSTIHKREVHP